MTLAARVNPADARRWAFGPLVVLLVASAAAAAPPAIPREFRGVWVASVANIDWPSKPGLSDADQKAELVAMFDQFRALNFNAIVLQVRPMCDSFYPSDLEPWSEFLTGTSGKAPGYDPLAFAVAEAHARGLELHAWFNPYRAASPAAKSEPAATHLIKTRPNLAKKYGKHHWLNPTHPDTRKHSLAVVADVVKRYDLDGIHLDDYFYPYPEKDAAGAEIPFPDDDTWAAYQQAGGKLGRDDWRRAAVNTFVEELYKQTKAAKPHVKVGISPFGIWRPGHPEGIAGFDQYAKLYADAKLWLNEGWVDYYTPQLYWPIKQEKQSYPKLLAWWAGENTHKRHLWPGNYSTKAAGTTAGWSVAELGDQITATRNQKGAGGNVHFSARPMLKSAKLTAALADIYPTPALVPASPWLGGAKPVRPTVVRAGDGARYLLSGDAETHLFAVQYRVDDKWTTRIVPADPATHAGAVTLPAETAEVVVTAISRTGVTGEAAGR